MKKSTPLLLFLILIIACGQKTETKKHSKDTSDLMDSLTHQIKLVNKEGKIVGLSVAIVDTSGILYNEGFGFSDSATEKAYSTETVQYVASVSKTLIGISLFKAQELDKLNIDEPVNNYLPFKVVNPNFPEIPITIRQLATHTSSITDSDAFWENDYILLDKNQPKNTGIPEYFNQPKNKIPISALLKELLTQDGLLNNDESFSTNEPNKKFDYSNVGSILCAFVIESAMGMSYQKFTEEYILNPLKMSASGWSVEDVNANNRSTLYVTNEQRMADYTTVGFPSSGLITSSKDLGKYLSEIINGYSGKGRLLTKESYQELFKKQLHKGQLPEGIDANVGIFMDYSRRGIGYNGYDPGLMAYMYFNPETLIGKVVIINTDTDFDEKVRPTLDSIWGVLEQYETKLNLSKRTGVAGIHNM